MHDSRPRRAADSSGSCTLFQGGRERASGKQRSSQACGVCVCKDLASPGPGTGPPAAELTCPRSSSCPPQIPNIPRRSPVPACSSPGPQREVSTCILSRHALFQKAAQIKTPLKRQLRIQSCQKERTGGSLPKSHSLLLRQPGTQVQSSKSHRRGPSSLSGPAHPFMQRGVLHSGQKSGPTRAHPAVPLAPPTK